MTQASTRARTSTTCVGRRRRALAACKAHARVRGVGLCHARPRCAAMIFRSERRSPRARQRGRARGAARRGAAAGGGGGRAHSEHRRCLSRSRRLPRPRWAAQLANKKRRRGGELPARLTLGKRSGRGSVGRYRENARRSASGDPARDESRRGAPGGWRVHHATASLSVAPCLRRRSRPCSAGQLVGRVDRRWHRRVLRSGVPRALARIRCRRKLRRPESIAPSSVRSCAVGSGRLRERQGVQRRRRGGARRRRARTPPAELAPAAPCGRAGYYAGRRRRARARARRGSPGRSARASCP